MPLAWRDDHALSGDELALAFVGECIALGVPFTPDERATYDYLTESLARSQRAGGSWLPTADGEELEWLLSVAENTASGYGYVSEWDNGFTIWRAEDYVTTYGEDD